MKKSFDIKVGERLVGCILKDSSESSHYEVDKPWVLADEVETTKCKTLLDAIQAAKSRHIDCELIPPSGSSAIQHP